MNGIPDLKKHYWLYALLLEQNKYYIGITSKKDPNERIKEHINGFYSAEWVKKYKVVTTLEKIDLGYIAHDEAEKQELHRTLQYMGKYGLQNVRGAKLNYSGKYLKLGNHFLRAEEVRLMGIILFFMVIFLLILILGKK